MRRAGSVNRAGLLFKNEPARQSEPARFQLTSCNSEAISKELTVDCQVGFKMMQNSVPSYKRARSPHVITSKTFDSQTRDSRIQNYRVASRLTQPFIFPRSIEYQDHMGT